MDYIPPKNKIPFKFGPEGYQPPDFSQVSFKMDVPLSDLKAAIVGLQIDSDYLKSCQEYIIGYDLDNLQIIRTDCVYGGIRDLQNFIDVESNIFNLHAYIKQGFVGQSDVFSIIKALKVSNLNIDGTIKGWSKEYIDLYSYIKQGSFSSENIQMYLNILYAQQENLRNNIKGYSIGNVVDILNTIRIKYEGVLDIPSYLKTSIQQDEDLSTIVYKILQRELKDLNKVLHGWQELQLQKLIKALHIVELPITLRSTYFNDLSGLLSVILPVDISAELHSWNVGNLLAYIIESKYDGDLNLNIFGISSEDLNFKIYVKRGLGVIKDLNASLTNLRLYDLGGILKTIQYSNLNVFLNSNRLYSDLAFKIYPKIIYVKHHINVSFLEHLDLAAVVNFPCFSSMYKDLTASLMVKHSKDLKIFMYGYDYSNIVDLPCSINASIYLSMSTVNLAYFHDPQPTSNINLRYENKQPYYSFGTINMWTNSFSRNFLNLPVSVYGNYLTQDLPVFIQARSNLHYKSNNLKERFVALKLKNNVEDFRRHVEVTFNSYAKHYTYFSGQQKAYRDVEEDHWVIRVEGSELLRVGKGFEKAKVKKKYIFNLKNYNSIDEAIKDMIDRVTTMKFFDLGASIESTNDSVSNLGAYLNSKRVYKSNRTLRASLKSGNFMSFELPTTLIPVFDKGVLNLYSSIVPIITSGNVDFEFSGAGDSIPNPLDAEFIFDLEDV